MQFAITAMDYTDAGALDRRMAQREAHLAGVKELVAKGHFISGGAILDGSGKMIGSTLHMEFADRPALDAVLQNDPYIKGKVWERIEICQVRLVPVASFKSA